MVNETWLDNSMQLIQPVGTESLQWHDEVSASEETVNEAWLDNSMRLIQPVKTESLQWHDDKVVLSRETVNQGFTCNSQGSALYFSMNTELLQWHFEWSEHAIRSVRSLNRDKSELLVKRDNENPCDYHPWLRFTTSFHTSCLQIPGSEICPLHLVNIRIAGLHARSQHLQQRASNSPSSTHLLMCF